jgi:GntR family transcriptional regulator
MAVRYQHIADDLRRRITSGEWEPGKRLPSEAELTTAYEVGTPTLRRALDVLEAEGRIEKRHGVGNFVREPLPRLTYLGGKISAEHRAASNMALQVGASSSQVAAESDLASLLSVPVGTPLTEYVYVSRLDGAPYSLARVYLPAFVAPLKVQSTNRSPWGNDLGDQFAAAGLHLATVVERFTARLPTAEEAETLRISGKTSVLAVERTSVDVAGRVIAGARLMLPGDRTEALFTTHAPSEELEIVR